MKKRTQEILEMLEKEDTLHGDETFWTLFQVCYPPAIWDAELEKLPEKFQRAYNNAGIEMLVDTDAMSLSPEFIEPGGHLNDLEDRYGITDEEWDECIDDCSNFVYAIVDATEEAIKLHGDYTPYCEAFDTYYEKIHVID